MRTSFIFFLVLSSFISNFITLHDHQECSLEDQLDTQSPAVQLEREALLSYFAKNPYNFLENNPSIKNILKMAKCPLRKDQYRNDVFFLSSIYRFKEQSQSFHHFPIWTREDQNSQAIQSVPLYDRRGQSMNPYKLKVVPSYNHPMFISQYVMNQPLQSQPFLPDPTDKETLYTLAKMTNNDYYMPNDTKHFLPVDPFSELEDFGWNNDGLRGYIYRNIDSSIIVMSVKGTSVSLFSLNDTNSYNDKWNDNRMFSCCCARVDFTWTPVCDCYAGQGNLCNESCLIGTLKSDDTTYLRAAQRIALDIMQTYPNAAIWFTGHSLGASLAALLTASFYSNVSPTKNIPWTASIGFEAPGERLYARRLGLISNDSIAENLPIYHVVNDGDPVPYGKCTGPTSTCYLAGYALESTCHLGQLCVYPSGSYFFDILNHRIEKVLSLLLASPTVPPFLSQTNCTDCGQWIYV